MHEFHRDGYSSPGLLAMVLCALTAMQVVPASGTSPTQKTSDRCMPRVVGSGSSQAVPVPTDWIGSWVTACLAPDGRVLDISDDNYLDTQEGHAASNHRYCKQLHGTTRWRDIGGCRYPDANTLVATEWVIPGSMTFRQAVETGQVWIGCGSSPEVALKNAKKRCELTSGCQCGVQDPHDKPGIPR